MRIYARMCLLGSQWWIITFMGPKSPKPPFWGLNRHFKPNMRKNSNSYIFRSVYQIDMKFNRQLRPATETSWVVSYGGKTILKWRMAAILKIDISPYLSEKSSDFHKNFVHSSRFWTRWTSRDQKWKSCIGQTPSSTERFCCCKVKCQKCWYYESYKHQNVYMIRNINTSHVAETCTYVILLFELGHFCEFAQLFVFAVYRDTSIASLNNDD